MKPKNFMMMRWWEHNETRNRLSHGWTEPFIDLHGRTYKRRRVSYEMLSLDNGDDSDISSKYDE